MKKTYTGEFRANVVNYSAEHGLGEAAKKFNVSYQTVRNWKGKGYKKQGVANKNDVFTIQIQLTQAQLLKIAKTHLADSFQQGLI